MSKGKILIYYQNHLLNK